MRENVEPLKYSLNEIKTKNEEQEILIKHLTAELQKVDSHYMQCCKAICATQGLVLKDVSGYEIQQQFVRRLVKEQEMRQRLKLHTGEDDLRNYMKLMSSHTSSEDEAPASQTGQQPARTDLPDVIMQEVVSPRVPQLIELKSKKVNITAALD